MKIRTITTGARINFDNLNRQIADIAGVLKSARAYYQKADTEVQSVRLTIQSWTDLSEKQRLRNIQALEQAGTKYGIDFISVSEADTPETISKIPDIILNTDKITACAVISNRKKGLDLDSIEASADAILAIAHNSHNGYGNFRFASIANCPPRIPFYPASYHKGGRWFALGLECSDLIHRAYAKDPRQMQKKLKSVFLSTAKSLQRIALKLESKFNIKFYGIDLSPAPSLLKQDSIAYAFKKITGKPFGSSGTLTIAGMITSVLNKLPVKMCGYSGLMLPVLEDYGLAQYYSSGQIKLSDLLTISAVCGTGLDCIPLAGTIEKRRLMAILSDIATLSLKLNKPLSARLLPVPGKKKGDQTQFNSPYLIDCVIPDQD